MMNIWWIQNEPFEGLGSIKLWADDRSHTLKCLRLFSGDKPDHIKECDMLVIMGGSMGVHDETQFQWLKDEKKIIEKAVISKIPVLGICLGAQLIAHVLGARVYKHTHKELGWFDVKRTGSSAIPILSGTPDSFMALHWHNDTFEIPHEAEHVFKSTCCPNQGFIYNNIVGLQFHLESTEQAVDEMVSSCAGEFLYKGEYCQAPEEIKNKSRKYCLPANEIIFRMLDAMQKAAGDAVKGLPA